MKEPGLILALKPVAADPVAAPASGRNHRFWDAFVVAALAALAVFIYANTLRQYFYADDLVFLAPYQKMFAHPEALPAAIRDRLLSPWMNESRAFLLMYRPLTEVTYLCDYACWGARAIGFHLGSLIAYVATSALVFFVLRRLTRMALGGDGTVFALVASLLFVASPLHTEPLYWLSARADILSAGFALASLWFFIEYQERKRALFLALSVCASALAFLAKEAGVISPVVLAAYYCFFCRPKGQSNEIKGTVKELARQMLPFVLVTLALLGLRLVVLGDLAGGYQGSAGEALSQSYYHRWIARGSIWRLLYPFNDDVVDNYHFNQIEEAFHIMYLAAGLFLCWRSIIAPPARAEIRFLGFLLVWMVLVVVPTAPVWYLADNLGGSRYLFFLSVPLSALVVLLLLPAAQAGHRWQQALRACGFVFLGSLLVLYIATCKIDNLAWKVAARMLTGLQTAVTAKCQSLPGKTKLLLANLPGHTDGAEVCCWQEQLDALLSPPLCAVNLASRVGMGNPTHYTYSDPVPIRRWHRIAGDKNRVVLFNTEKGDLMEAALPALSGQACAEPVWFETHTGAAGAARAFAIYPRQALDPGQLDTLYIDMASTPQAFARSLEPALQVSWSGGAAKGLELPAKCRVAIFPDGKLHRYRVCLGEQAAWLFSRRVRCLILCLPEGMRHEVAKIEFAGPAQTVPELACEKREDVDGVCHLTDRTARFSYDATKIPGACRVVVEVTEANCSFVDYTGTYRDSSLCKAARARLLPGLAGTFVMTLAPGNKRPNRYELRVTALDRSGRVAGAASEPLLVEPVCAAGCVKHTAGADS